MTKLPLEGIRVIELGVVWAGPYACRLLADWGAEVIKLESCQHYQFYTRGFMPKMPQAIVDISVGYAAYKRDGYDPEKAHNMSTLFNGHASNKLSMTVDLNRPEGMDILRRLVQVSDVLIENNSPSIKEKMGLSWEVMSAWNPELIMLSMPGFGGFGPYKYYRALGSQMDDYVGHGYSRCYLDEEYDTSSAVYHADEAGGINGALAVMMALFQRRRTGKGQYIDMALAEASGSHLGQAAMDFSMNRRITEKTGNREYHTAVQGCYRCKDVPGRYAGGIEFPDAYVNITILDDEQWKGFCRAIGNPPWTNEERFSTVLGRHKDHGELDTLIEAWTREHDNHEVMHLLQREGVPAGIVMDEKNAYEDPHVRTRGFFNELAHPVCGTHEYPGIAWKMSETPNSLRLPPPCFGEHNEYVYKKIIGVSDEEYADLESKGHIGTTYVSSIGFSL